MTAPDGAPFDTDRVENLVTSFLTAIVSAAASFTPPVTLPARQISGAGRIPYDCEEVFATVLTVGTGTPEALGLTGTSTFPVTASGANQTLYNAVILLAIVRTSLEKITGMGIVPPDPTLFTGNLGLISQDTAVLMAALGQVAEAQSSASPRTITANSPQGGLIATTLQVTILL